MSKWATSSKLCFLKFIKKYTRINRFFWNNTRNVRQLLLTAASPRSTWTWFQPMTGFAAASYHPASSSSQNHWIRSQQSSTPPEKRAKFTGKELCAHARQLLYDTCSKQNLDLSKYTLWMNIKLQAQSKKNNNRACIRKGGGWKMCAFTDLIFRFRTE